MKQLRLAMRHDDSGIALVVAMGVALVGITVASLVIAQTVMASSDSGRDRLRTTEVHAAEAAIDATMAELEASTPCLKPSFSPKTYGSGAQQTSVAVTIQYYDDAGAIGCSGGVPTRLPDRAIVQATSEGTGDGLGLQPVRTVEAELNLTPRVNLSNNAAIFSSMDLTTSTGLKLSPALLDQQADVWVDSGSWYCNVPTTITGGLYLPTGGLKFNNGCFISGDTWVQQNFEVTGADPVKNTIGKNLTVRGNLKHVASNNWRVGGNVTIGGTETTNGRVLIAGGTKQVGVGAGSIANMTAVGIPQISYIPGDWTSKGFVIRSKADIAADIKSQWVLGAKPWTHTNIDNCDWAGWISEGKPLKFPTNLTTQNTVYDLRSCTNVTPNNNITFEFYADTALFVKNYNSTGTVIFKSGDGKPHKVWIISPIAGGGYTPGNITSSPEMSVQAPLETFWYTPLTLTLKSASSIRGQVYGGTVSMSSPVTFEYTDVGVPGVSLVSAVKSANGFVVELAYKREVS